MKVGSLFSAALASVASASTTISSAPTEQRDLDLKPTHQPQLEIQDRVMTFGKRQLVVPSLVYPSMGYPTLYPDIPATPSSPWYPTMYPDIPVLPSSVTVNPCPTGDSMENFPTIPPDPSCGNMEHSRTVYSVPASAPITSTQKAGGEATGIVTGLPIDKATGPMSKLEGKILNIFVLASHRTDDSAGIRQGFPTIQTSVPALSPTGA